MKIWPADLAVALLLTLLVALCFGSPQHPTVSVDENTELAAAPLAAAPLATCTLRGALPDPRCTPGAVIPSATVAHICTPGYAKSVRNVPESEKRAVYAAYGITSHTPGQYEVDHLVSLELGGSNDVKNLWPEAAEPRPGFHQKDAVENEAHAAVCAGTLSLADAQAAIASDWVALMHRLEGQR